MHIDPTAITAPFRMQPGLSRLAPGQRQLTPSRPGDPVLDAKLAVLRNTHAQALCKLPDWDDCPALDALAEQARLDAPEAWHVDDAAVGSRRGAAAGDAVRRGQRRWTARHLGWSLDGDLLEGNGPPEIGECLRSLPPQWRRAGLLSLAFAEDFAVLEAPAGGSGSIPWLAVCLPSHWAPEAKVGRTFAAVHAPVADSAALLRAGNALSHLVIGPDRWQRTVWTVTPDGRLDGHPQRQAAAQWPIDADACRIGEMAWLRTEHQTFIPVPGHPQAVFTILVETGRLAELLADPQHGRQLQAALHAAIASMSPAVLDYRRLTGARQRLLDWLSATPGR